jgi:hypothetical protein
MQPDRVLIRPYWQSPAFRECHPKIVAEPENLQKLQEWQRQVAEMGECCCGYREWQCLEGRRRRVA